MIAILSHYGVTNVLTCDDLRIENMGDWYEVTVYDWKDCTSSMKVKCSEIRIVDNNGIEMLSRIKM